MTFATRLAPSPTGGLHLGNARTFLATWLLARQGGWRVLLRVDDLDAARVKPGASAAALEDLSWLGLDWDGAPTLQSRNALTHNAAVERLLEMGRAYPCVCTRAEVQRAASAPHAEDGAAVYPGTCRGRFASVEEARAFAGRAPCVRFALGDEALAFDDLFAGRQNYEAPRCVLGDFPVRGFDGVASYQLATVVDDRAAGVTHVVRGDDLLDSTPRQLALYEALFPAERVPAYAHLPLVVGPDGRRLAKRHGAIQLRASRERGTSAANVVGRLARSLGMEVESATARELVGAFDLARVPRGRVQL